MYLCDMVHIPVSSIIDSTQNVEDLDSLHVVLATARIRSQILLAAAAQALFLATQS